MYNHWFITTIFLRPPQPGPRVQPNQDLEFTPTRTQSSPQPGPRVHPNQDLEFTPTRTQSSPQLRQPFSPKFVTIVLTFSLKIILRQFLSPFHKDYLTTNFNLTTKTTLPQVYSIQHYVIKFVSDLRQVNGFLPVLQFSPPIKLTDILLKGALNTINHLPQQPSVISIAQQSIFF